MDAAEPGPGEVRVRLAFSGINPGDTKKRADWLGSPMPFPRVIPHSDGAGSIDAVGDGVDAARVGQRVWIVDVAFSDNIDLDAAVAAPDAVIAAYATRDARPTFPFWPMLFANLTIRLLGSDDFPLEAKRQAAEDLTAAAREGALSIPIADPLPLDRIAEAHDRVDAGTRQRVLLAIPSP